MRELTFFNIAVQTLHITSMSEREREREKVTIADRDRYAVNWLG